MQKYLIVNADDLGLARPTNLAIGQAFREGILTSASLMANMPACRHALEQVVRPNPGLGVGIHFCLTSGRPVLPAASVQLLVNRRGEFCRGFFGLYRLLYGRQRHAASAQIAAELRAQIQRLDHAGICLDHVDSHQHVHMIPPIFAVVAELAAARGAAVRIADEHFRLAPRWLPRWLACATNGGLAKKVILSHFAREDRGIGQNGRHADHYFGVLETGKITPQVLREVFAALPSGFAEINCHPGPAGPADETMVCSQADRHFHASPNRAAELAALMDPALRNALSAAAITLARFQDIPATFHGEAQPAECDKSVAPTPAASRIRGQGSPALRST